MTAARAWTSIRPRRFPRRAAAWALAFAAGIGGSLAADPEALRVLRDNARVERQNPHPTAAVKPPSGLELLAEPLSDSGGLRDADLGAALKRVKPFTPADPPAEPVDEPTQRQSIRLYVRGQTALVENLFNDAAKDLADAAELNPTAPEPWELLAQAQARSGRMNDAVTSIRRAYEAGSTDPTTLMTYWRSLRRERKWEDSASVAVRLRDAARASEDVGLTLIADAALAESLLAMGAAAAGAQLIVDTLGRSSNVSAPRWAEEYAELVRRRAELWTAAGDARVRLGQLDEALKLYERASAEPSPDPSALIERRVYVLLRSGLAAGAAALIVDERASSTTLATERTGSLIRMVGASDPGAAAMISAALTGIADEPGTTSMTRRARLVRTAAAGLTPAQARELLLTRLDRIPEAGLIDDLLERWAPAEPAGVVTLAGEVLNCAPWALDRVAWLVWKATNGAADRVVTARPGLTGAAALPGADALVAAMLVRAGRFDDAKRAAAEGDRLHTDDPRWLLWRTRIAAACADWDAAELAVGTLTAAADRDPANAALAARALLALQRPEEALAMFERAIAAQGPTPTIADLMGAADLAEWLGREALGESYVMRAATADPQAEAPRLRLLEAAGTSDDPDRDRLATMIRELRDVAPNSRGLRLIRAQELRRARQFTQALGEYAVLLSDDPDDEDAGEGLLRIAINLPATDPGLARLRTRAAQLRDAARVSPWPAMAEAVLALRAASAAKDDDARTAAFASADAVMARMYDADVIRVWASLNREVLEPQAGSRRILEKLAGYPANADIASTRAAAHAVLNDMAATIADLDGLPAAMNLRPAQAAPLLTALEAPAIAAVDAPGAPASPATSPGLRPAIDRAFDRAGRLTPELHAARLKLMVSDREFDMPTLVRAAREAAAQVPNPGAVHLAVVKSFDRQGMPQAAVEFSRLSAAEEPPGSAVLHVLWMNFAAARGSAEDAAAAVRASCEPGRIDATARELATDADGRRIAENPSKADVAYDVASVLAARGLDDATLVYDLALEYDPNHRLSNNDLGYTLLERDERRMDALRMIENAYRVEPDDGNVLDSIAWLRYRQARFTDDTGGPGAVTLLRKAVVADEKDSDPNPTLQDHLGDALFRAGDRESAAKAWRLAESAASNRVSRAGPNASQRYLKRFTDMANDARRKLLALTRGTAPEVAPTWAELDARKAAKGATAPTPTPGPDGENR